MPKPHILIITPALASANNGNWRTTDRWSEFLRPHFHVNAALQFDSQPCDIMLALHARRSANSIAQFATSAKHVGTGASKPTGNGLVVVLTGTDLYRDIRADAAAQRSLELANRLVVLQAEGLRELSPDHQKKCVVIEQSAPTIPAIPPRADTFDLVMVGHLRAEKDPLTAVRALQRLTDPRLRLRHAGKTDDPQLGPPVRAAAAADTRIELLGGLTHDHTRQLIAQGRLLLLPSLMEGGANVLIEAVTSGVAVLASRISGSIGMLGDDYPGYFEVGNDEQLAALIHRCQHEADFLGTLHTHCAQRAVLFAPQREQDALLALVRELLGEHH